MNNYYCSALYSNQKYDLTVDADNMEHADRAFQQHLYMTRFLTKDCADSWLIDKQLMTCDD